MVDKDYLYISGIKHDSIVDGDGFRNIIFISGCPWHCYQCHNPTTHDMYNGTKMTIDEIVENVYSDNNDITLSGGDPLTYQIEQVVKLLKRLKQERPLVNIWVYTGWEWEQLLSNSETGTYITEALKYIDVLVDGKFIYEKRNLDLLFRGSSNQRLIDVQQSLKENKVVLYCD